MGGMSVYSPGAGGDQVELGRAKGNFNTEF